MPGITERVDIQFDGGVVRIEGDPSVPPGEMRLRLTAEQIAWRDRERRKLKRRFLGLPLEAIGPTITDHDGGDEHNPNVVGECVAAAHRDWISRRLRRLLHGE